MKKKYLFITLIITFVIEIVVTIVMFNNISTIKNDTVKINELVNEIELNYPNDSNYPKDFNYVLLDNNGFIIKSKQLSDIELYCKFNSVNVVLTNNTSDNNFNSGLYNRYLRGVVIVVLQLGEI